MSQEPTASDTDTGSTADPTPAPEEPAVVPQPTPQPAAPLPFGVEATSVAKKETTEEAAASPPPEEDATELSAFEPVPTHTFYPPTCTSFGRGDAEADRARIISSHAIDAHIYDDHFKGIVNVAKNSAACPASYTGRFRDSLRVQMDALDTSAVTVSKHMADVNAVNGIYADRRDGGPVADPRYARQSHMLVVRDYTCRMPVDPRLMERAVTAAVQEYPQKYVSFVSEFVDATMGRTMATFLGKMADRFDQHMEPSVASFLNVMSWKMYALLTKAPGGDEAGRDSTINLVPERATLGGDAERGMMQSMSPCPGFSLLECLQDKVATYTELKDMCRGFACSSLEARVMLEACNLWGREWCENAMLLDESGEVDYGKLRLMVPMSLALTKENNIPVIADFEQTREAARVPSCNPAIHADLAADMRCEDVVHVPSYSVPFGRWMGTLTVGAEEIVDALAADDGAPPLAPTHHAGSNLDVASVDAAGGFRYGFGHSALAFVKLNDVDRYSNYFTPYRFQNGERVAAADKYELEVAVCDIWGQPLFNDPARWGIQASLVDPLPATVEEPARQGQWDSMLRPDATQEASSVALADSHVPATGATGGVSYRSSLTRELTMGTSKDAFDTIAPNLFEVVTPNARDKGERPLAGCVFNPFDDVNEPYGHRLFRHNMRGMLYIKASDGLDNYEVARELMSCITADASGKLFATPSFINAGTAPGTTSAVRLYHTGEYGVDGVDPHGYKTTEVTTVATPLKEYLIGGSLGSDNDAALEMRMAKLFVARGIGMHLAHYLFTDVCAYPNNAREGAHPMPSRDGFLAAWRSEQKGQSGFAFKLGRLLNLYASSRDGSTSSFMQDVVDTRMHLATEPSVALVRDEFAAKYSDLLPLCMPRCFLSELPASLQSVLGDDARDVASIKRELRLRMRKAAVALSLTQADPTAPVHATPDPDRGYAWASLYAHLMDTDLNAVLNLDVSRTTYQSDYDPSWPLEYRSLRRDMAKGLNKVLISAMTSTEQVPNFTAHSAQVLPKDADAFDAWAKLAGTTTSYTTYRVFRSGDDEAVHMQSVVDAGREPAAGATVAVGSLDRIGDATYVDIPNAYYYDDDATTLTSDARSTVRTYMRRVMPRALRSAASEAVQRRLDVPILSGVAIDGQVVALPPTGAVIGIGHGGVRAGPDGSYEPTWLDGSVREVVHDGRGGEGDGAYASAWTHFRRLLPGVTLDVIRQLGLHPTTRDSFEIDDRYLFDKRLYTPDVRAPTVTTPRGRLPLGRLLDHIMRLEEIHGRALHEKKVYDEIFQGSEDKVEDIALQACNVTDYALQMRIVFNRVRASRKDGGYGYLFAHETEAKQILSCLVNDSPLLLRLLVELDCTLGVQSGASASRRRENIERHEIFQILNRLTGGDLFYHAGFTERDRDTAPTYRGVHALAPLPPRYRAVTDATSFYLEDENGTLFAHRTPISDADLTRRYQNRDMYFMKTRVGPIGETSKFSADFLNPHAEDGQLAFSMLDAAALLWYRRKYHSPADAMRCVPRHQSGRQQDGQHHTVRYLLESFIHSRETYSQDATLAGQSWEHVVRREPTRVFPSTALGAMCEQSWKEEFPGFAADHALRHHLDKVRRLSLMWGTLPQLRVDARTTATAWVPVPLYEHHVILRMLGAFNAEHRMPRSPWVGDDGRLRQVFRSSSHSAYRKDPNDPASESKWRSALRYAPPSRLWRPFALYGGELVTADFCKHRVEDISVGAYTSGIGSLHRELLTSRYGVTRPLGLADSAHLGLVESLSHMLGSEEDGVAATGHMRLSNFMAYGRNHVLLGLASAAEGQPGKLSAAKCVGNLFRTYVDTYACGGNTDTQDNVPFVMGYYRAHTGVVYVAGTMGCINSKLLVMTSGSPERPLKIHQGYAMHFNEAALIVEKLVRAQRAAVEYAEAFETIHKARPEVTEAEYYRNLVRLKDEHVDLLHRLLIGMLVKAGVDYKKLPLQALELKPIDPMQAMEMSDLSNKKRTAMGSEYINQHAFVGTTKDLVQTSHLSRNAMHFRNLFASSDAAVGALLTLRMRDNGESVAGIDTSRLKEAETLRQTAWEDYATQALDGALSVRVLERDVDALAMPNHAAAALAKPPARAMPSSKLMSTFLPANGKVGAPSAISHIGAEVTQGRLHSRPEARARYATASTARLNQIADLHAKLYKTYKKYEGDSRITFAKVVEAAKKDKKFGLGDPKVRSLLPDVLKMHDNLEAKSKA